LATPFVLGVVGDFGGRRPASASFRRIDRDTFERVLAQSGVSMELPMPIGAARLRIESLADFHPDVLRRLVPAGPTVEEAPPFPKPAAAVSTPAAPAGGDLLDRVLRETQEEPAAVAPALEELVRRAAEPSLVRRPAPRAWGFRRRSPTRSGASFMRRGSRRSRPRGARSMRSSWRPRPARSSKYAS
jgi:hypothetical protein